jgi:dephospho-CoA kinase
MLRVAVTGGIGTGKSTVLAQFRTLGIPVAEADVLAHDVVAPGTPGAARVLERFGPEVFGPDGTLDRRRLGHIVFADGEARRDLEQIVHPAVYSALASWSDGLAARGEIICAAEIPLLFETGHESDFARIVVTACREEAQIRRVAARTGLPVEEIRRRIVAQWPIEEKIRRADYVIRTDGTLEDTRSQAVAVGQQLLDEARAPADS